MSWINETLSYRTYIKDIKDFEPLTVEDEKILKDKILAGDEKAKLELYKRHLKFVVYEAKKYYSDSVKVIELGDLISEGNIGLLTAIEKFKYDKDNRFMTYAIYYVKNHIISALNRDQQSIKLPLNIDRDDPKYPKCLPMICTNSEDGTEFDLEIPGAVEQPELVINQDPKILTKLINGLSEDERKVVNLYYGMGDVETSNLEKIGDIMNLSKERVRQIRDKALRRLRSNSHLLFDSYEKMIK